MKNLLTKIKAKVSKRKKIILVLLLLLTLIVVLCFLGSKERNNAGDEGVPSPVLVEASRLVIPVINLNEPIYDDEKPGAIPEGFLNQGLAYYDEETNQPGEGNAVIFGHSAVTAEHEAPFAKVGKKELEKGDTLILSDKKTGQYTYEVSEIKTVEADDFSILKASDVPTVTLVTCIAPDFPTDKRLVVVGRLKQ